MAFNWGAFAGAATDAYQQERENQRRMQWEDYMRGQQKSEAERQAQARQAAAQTLGRAGTEIGDAQGYGGMTGMGAMSPEEYAQAPKTRTYSEDEAFADYGRRMAQLGDAGAAVGARKTALEVKGLERGERKEAKAEKDDDDERTILGVMRDFKTGKLDGQAAFRRLAGVNAKHANGIAGGITEVNGQPMLVITNEQMGQTQITPWNDAAVEHAGQQMLRYLNPKKYAQERELDLKGREVGAKEKTAEASGITAQAARQRALTDQEYQGRGGVLDRHYQRADRNSASSTANQDRPAWKVVGTDKDGTPIVQNERARDPRQMFQRQDGQPIQDVSIFRRLTGEPNAAPKDAVNPDGSVWRGGVLYVPGAKPGEFVPAQLPGNIPGAGVFAGGPPTRGARPAAPAAAPPAAPRAAALQVAPPAAPPAAPQAAPQGMFASRAAAIQQLEAARQATGAAIAKASGNPVEQQRLLQQLREQTAAWEQLRAADGR